MLYSNPTDKVKWLKFWLVFLFVAGIIFCVIGVILWIIVGGVVANPPYGSKCYQRGKCIHKANSFTYVYNSYHAITVFIVIIVYKQTILACIPL